MTAFTQLTDRAVLTELGTRLTRHRLERNLTQAKLARDAGVSKRTLIRLENGESTQLTNLIRVVRALGLLGNLEAFIPAPLPSPIEQLRMQGRTRRRASSRTKDSETKAPWRWGGKDDDRSAS